MISHENICRSFGVGGASEDNSALRRTNIGCWHSAREGVCGTKLCRHKVVNDGAIVMGKTICCG